MPVHDRFYIVFVQRNLPAKTSKFIVVYFICQAVEYIDRATCRVYCIC